MMMVMLLNNKKLTMFEASLISLFTSLVHQFDNEDGTDITDDDTLLMTQNDFIYIEFTHYNLEHHCLVMIHHLRLV
jgi:hypothetical protein